jgi:three-Cys-motif partner protein
MSGGKKQSRTRPAHRWTMDKLEFLEKYVPGFLTACKKSWYTCYVDGFAGPGTNTDVTTGMVRHGSPLIALNAVGAAPDQKQFDTLHFVEADPQTANTLWENIKDHPDAGKVLRYQEDFNQVISRILGQINQQTPTLFLLDPEDLSLKWSTVEQIGKRDKADVFVLVSASGVQRNINNPASHPRITEFFGSESWLTVKSQLEGGEMPGISGFDAFLKLYTDQLGSLGFDVSDYRIIARNSKNAAMHGLVFASKHPAALNIANHILKGITSQGQDPLGF